MSHVMLQGAAAQVLEICVIIVTISKVICQKEEKRKYHEQ